VRRMENRKKELRQRGWRLIGVYEAEKWKSGSKGVAVGGVAFAGFNGVGVFHEEGLGKDQ
jgi:hypothetical protein